MTTSQQLFSSSIEHSELPFEQSPQSWRQGRAQELHTQPLYYPPSHFSKLLENVKNRNNFLNLGLHSTASEQAFFELYHEFQGDIVGIDRDSSRVKAVQERAHQVLPTQALTRTRLIAGDFFDLNRSLKTNTSSPPFDLVTLGSEVHNVATADRLFDFVNHQLLAADGTLAILSVRPESIQFATSSEEEQEVEAASAKLKQDFAEFTESISEYNDLSSNPLYNEGVQTRHFSEVIQLHNKVDSLITADSLLACIRQSYAFTQYQNDATQADKTALITFQRKLHSAIQAHKSQNHLIRVSHKILTYILKR